MILHGRGAAWAWCCMGVVLHGRGAAWAWCCVVLRADILHGDDIEVCILDDEEGRGYGTLCNVADTVLLSLRFPQSQRIIFVRGSLRVCS